MKTALFAKTQAEISPYIAVYKEALTAKGWVNGKTGVVNKFPTEHKVLWCYMLDRYEFFKSTNKQWFDDQEDIANACGISRSTVQRFLKLLNEAGVVLITSTRQYGGHISNSYVITRDLELVQEDKKTAPSKSPQQRKQAPEPQKEHTAPPLDDFVPAGPEWASEPVPDDVYDDFLLEPEDDGSCSDAFAYGDVGELPETPVVVQEEAPATIHGVSLADMPSKRFKPNGDVSDEMAEWCARNNIKIFEAEYDVQFLFKGIPHVFNNNTFVPCSSKPARKQVIEEFPAPF